jgi:hypothetical protein
MMPTSKETRVTIRFMLEIPEVIAVGNLLAEFDRPG